MVAVRFVDLENKASWRETRHRSPRARIIESSQNWRSPEDRQVAIMTILDSQVHFL